MKKNRIFSGKDGRDDAIKYLNEMIKKYQKRREKFSQSATRLADIPMPEVSDTDTTQEIYRKASDLRRRIDAHMQSVLAWKKKGREYAKEVSEDSSGRKGGQEAADLYAYIIDSFGGDRTPDDYESDDVLEAADNLIQDNAMITKQSLIDEITAIRDKRAETLDEDVDSIIF